MQSSSTPSVLWETYINSASTSVQAIQPPPPTKPGAVSGEYNLVVVPSMIHVPNAPLSYTHRRSLFTDMQRLQQTLDTFRTIREKIPNAYIVHAEGSTLTPEEHTLIQPYMDYLWDASLLPEVVKATTGPAKGHGEAMQLLSYFNSPHFQALRTRCASISKFGARIRLTDRFQFRAPTHGKPILKIAANGDRNVCNFGPRSILTVFYTVPPGEAFDVYRKGLETCCQYPGFVSGQLGIENLLYETWLKDIEFEAVPFMGLEGYCAPFGNYYHV